MTFPTFVALMDFVVLAHGGGTANAIQQIAYAAGQTIQFVFPLWCVWLIEGRLPRTGKPSVRGVTWGLGFGLVIAVGMIGLYYLALRHTAMFSQTPTKVRHKLEEFGAASPLGFALFAFLISMPHSLLEEYYWRWFVFGGLQRLLGITPAVIVSSLAFMSHHVVILWVYFPGHVLTAVVPFSLCVAGGGALWAWLYQRAGSVYAPWLSHLLVDAALFVVGYDLFFVRPG